ncbi:MAG: zinc carboxypeptidase, partial [Bacteroidetes bacterium]|nr:zinc carboxypeptidase [Bacteroidota bacterium]
MKKLISLAVLSAIVSLVVAQELKSPEEFLGYQLGERFTRHYRVVDYFKHVASVMTNIKVEQYGETNEHRPLIVAYVTSQKNFDRLEEIRQNNLRRAGLESGTVSDEEIAIVWLSYNVHGNESSSTEATMLTLYELANPSNQKTQKWLENTVVILDPCINPDGRDRYANFYSQYGNKIPNPNLDSKEH